MNAWRSLRVAAVLATLSTVFSSPLPAATHDVMVLDNFFSPSDIAIQVGDTVRWTNAAGGSFHDVTRDDFSWASVTASSFVFERTFNTPEEVLYHCAVHSSPGRDRNTNMNGRVMVEAAAPEFTINAGLNDAWLNPETGGQGFFITVFPDARFMFLSWFAYEFERPPEDAAAKLGEPGHRWLTAGGSYSGNSATLDVNFTEGGIFDSHRMTTQAPNYGTIIVTFTGCNSGEVMYDIPSVGRAGIVPIQRIALDNVPLCESLAAP